MSSRPADHHGDCVFRRSGTNKPYGAKLYVSPQLADELYEERRRAEKVATQAEEQSRAQHRLELLCNRFVQRQRAAFASEICNQCCGRSWQRRLVRVLRSAAPQTPALASHGVAAAQRCGGFGAACASRRKFRRCRGSVLSSCETPKCQSIRRLFRNVLGNFTMCTPKVATQRIQVVCGGIARALRDNF